MKKVFLLLAVLSFFMLTGCNHTISVNFDTNGGTAIERLSLTYKDEVSNGVSVTRPTDPTKMGYVFDGWYADKKLTEEFNFDRNYSSDLIIYAKWILAQPTITFETSGGTAIDSVQIDTNTACSKPSDPTKVGYTFENWYSDSELTTLYDFTTLVKDSMTLYAKWTINQYTITFETNGGSEQGAIIRDFHSLIDVPDPIKTGYTFAGWYLDSALTQSFDTPIETDLVLYADWTINHYTLTFNTSDGTAISPVDGVYDSLITLPSEPTKAGFLFGGWYSDATLRVPFALTTVPNNDVTLYAKWINPTPGLVYQLVDTTHYIITGYTGTSKDLFIPTLYNNLPILSIDANAFSSKSITSISFEEDSLITTFGNYAFANSTLATITLPQQLESIGNHAFEGTAITSLVLPQSITFIGAGAFLNSDIETITFEPLSLLTSISEEAFAYTPLQTIDFGEGMMLTSIGDYAFASTKLTEINLPSSLESIGEKAFFSCLDLVSITVEDGNTHYLSQNHVLFNIDLTTLILYPAKLSGPFTIPSTVTMIGDDAFYGTTLTSIIIPSSVQIIGETAFAYSDIEIVQFEADSQLQEIHNYAFGYSPLYSINLETLDHLISIGDYAFGVTDITQITIPSTVTTLGSSPFLGCLSLTAIDVAVGNSTFESVNGILYSEDLTHLIEYPSGITGDYTLADSVTTIEYSAFALSQLTTFTVSTSSQLTDLVGATFLGSTITTFTFNLLTPPQSDSYYTVFYFITNFTIQVPANAQSSYIAAIPDYSGNIVPF